MKRRLAIGAIGLLLAGCGSTASPTVNAPATQMRSTEIAQVQGLQTQVTGLSFTPTALAATATTPLPTPTIQPTATPIRTAVATLAATIAPIRPTVAPVTPTTPVIGKVGERVISRGLAVTIAQVIDPLPRGQYNTPKPGFRWVAFDVIVENAGSSPLDYNPYFARLKTVDNREYTFGISSPDLKPLLQYGTHQPGESSRGWIGFEIQEDAQLASLSYTPGGSNPRVIIDLR